jgi:YqaJ-like viral recombinase domain
MQILNCEQGSEEWYAARCGRITASCFVDAVDKIGKLDDKQAMYVRLMLQGATKQAAAEAAGYKAAPTSDIVRRALLGEETEQFSDIAKRYAADLAIERISGRPHGEPVKAWVLERGHFMESRARMIHEIRMGLCISESGLCVADDGIFAYSSDGMTEDFGLIEIKAPIDSAKIMRMWQTGDVSEYMHQMQGGMWITGRQYCDLLMYVPDLEAVGKDLFVKRVPRDEKFISEMVVDLMKFADLVSATEAVFRGNLPAVA